jgi:hypothetical protein
MIRLRCRLIERLNDWMIGSRPSDVGFMDRCEVSPKGLVAQITLSTDRALPETDFRRSVRN